VVQAWVTPRFAREIKELADRDGRSVSSLIKVALRDRLAETSPEGEDRRPAGVSVAPSPAEALTGLTASAPRDRRPRWQVTLR
jgi:hypothetical protein